MLIPHRQLSPKALQGLIEEFVTRDGADYGQTESALATKVAQVWRQLDQGVVVILSSEHDGSVTIANKAQLPPGLDSARGD